MCPCVARIDLGPHTATAQRSIGKHLTILIRFAKYLQDLLCLRHNSERDIFSSFGLPLQGLGVVSGLQSKTRKRGCFTGRLL
jgi:hypothetical protein